MSMTAMNRRIRLLSYFAVLVVFISVPFLKIKRTIGLTTRRTVMATIGIGALGGLLGAIAGFFIAWILYALFVDAGYAGLAGLYLGCPVGAICGIILDVVIAQF